MKNRIELKELLDIAHNENYLGLIDMTFDCCFSGELCYTARRLMKNYKFHLKITACTDRDQPSFYGSYSRVLKDQIFQKEYSSR